jgi:arylsulfatase
MPDQRPNILWICANQQHYDTIHALNNPVICTPYLDRLVRGGRGVHACLCVKPDLHAFFVDFS